MKRFFIVLFVVLLSGISLSLAEEQNGFAFDNLYLGPTIGYTYVLGGSLGLGLRGEYGLIDGSKGGSFPGSLGLGLEFCYSSYSQTWFDGKWSYTLISFLVFGSYHIQPKEVFDPYVRVGLGFDNVSTSWTWANGSEANIPYSSAYGSGLGYEISVGFNYHLSRNMSVRADLGYPFLLSAGIDFNLGEMGWQQKQK